MAAKALIRAGQTSGYSPSEEIAWLEVAMRRAAADPEDALAARMHEKLVSRWSIPGMFEDAYAAAPSDVVSFLAFAYLGAQKWQLALEMAYQLDEKSVRVEAPHLFFPKFAASNLSSVVRARAFAGLGEIDNAEREYALAILRGAPVSSKPSLNIPPLAAASVQLERGFWLIRVGRSLDGQSDITAALKAAPLLILKIATDADSPILSSDSQVFRNALLEKYRAASRQIAELWFAEIKLQGDDSIESIDEAVRLVDAICVLDLESSEVASSVLRNVVTRVLRDWIEGIATEDEAAEKIAQFAAVLARIAGHSRAEQLVGSACREIGFSSNL